MAAQGLRAGSAGEGFAKRKKDALTGAAIPGYDPLTGRERAHGSRGT